MKLHVGEAHILPTSLKGSAQEAKHFTGILPSLVVLQVSDSYNNMVLALELTTPNLLLSEVHVGDRFCVSNSGLCVHPVCKCWHDLLNKLSSIYKLGYGLKAFPSPMKNWKHQVRFLCDRILTSTQFFTILINEIWLLISKCGVMT